MGFSNHHHRAALLGCHETGDRSRSFHTVWGAAQRNPREVPTTSADSRQTIIRIATQTSTHRRPHHNPNLTSSLPIHSGQSPPSLPTQLHTWCQHTEPSSQAHQPQFPSLFIAKNTEILKSDPQNPQIETNSATGIPSAEFNQGAGPAAFHCSKTPRSRNLTLRIHKSKPTRRLESLQRNSTRVRAQAQPGSGRSHYLQTLAHNGLGNGHVSSPPSQSCRPSFIRSQRF